MRKLVIGLFVMVLMFGLTTNALANTTPKSANVSLLVNGAEVTDESAVLEVNQGDLVNFAANTVKQGSSYDDNWKVNGVDLAHSTALNTLTSNYESSASLDTSSAGEFEIEYSIVMLAGKSSVTFVGGKKTNVTVVEPTVSVKKITIKVKTVVPRLSSGSRPAVTGFDAIADANVVFSDGSTDVIEDINIDYNKFSKDSTVTLQVVVGGETSTFELDVPFVAPGTEVVFNDPIPAE